MLKRGLLKQKGSRRKWGEGRQRTPPGNKEGWFQDQAALTLKRCMDPIILVFLASTSLGICLHFAKNFYSVSLQGNISPFKVFLHPYISEYLPLGIKIFS